MIRRGLVIALAVLMSVQVLRSAAVTLSSDPAIGWAGAVWPDHPSVLAGTVMGELETAVSQQKPLNVTALTKTKTLARKDPLASEPFLSLGVNAYLNGNGKLAQRFLLEARRRDARVPAVRYFLAKTNIDEGRLAPAVNEAVALGRLIPGTIYHLTPVLLELVRERGGVDQVRQVLRLHPDLAPDLFDQLARDPANVELLIALAPSGKGEPRSSHWQQRLVQGLLERREYEKAWLSWTALNARSSHRELIHDPGFRDVATPPPFNWAFADNGAIIDRINGELRITYHGRKKTVLARQTLLLPRGSYVLAFKLSGEIPDPQTMSWDLSCIPEKRLIAELLLSEPKGNSKQLPFVIPSNCEGQELRLVAEPRDFARSSSFEISHLQLTKTQS